MVRTTPTRPWTACQNETVFGPVFSLSRKCVHEFLEPHFGVLEDTHPIPKQKLVKFQIKKAAHASLEVHDVINHLLAQQPATPRRIADHRVPYDQELALGPVQSDLSW